MHVFGVKGADARVYLLVFLLGLRFCGVVAAFYCYWVDVVDSATQDCDTGAPINRNHATFSEIVPKKIRKSARVGHWWWRVSSCWIVTYLATRCECTPAIVVGSGRTRGAKSNTRVSFQKRNRLAVVHHERGGS